MDIQDLEKQLVRCEAKIDLLVQMVAKLNGRDAGHTGAPHSSNNLSKLTTKQHAALQMVLSGKSNNDIAERFGVSTNTAKVYVRSIAAKLGVNTRNQIVVMMLDDFKNIPDDEYALLSGGLPKDWDATYRTPDKYATLYATKTR